MTITGGEITVWTANTADNQPLDADGAITITGGTVLAAGGSGSMRMQLTTEQPYLLQQSGAAIVAGETLSIADADGTNILGCMPGALHDQLLVLHQPRPDGRPVVYAARLRQCHRCS